MARKTIDKAAVERAMGKLSALAFENGKKSVDFPAQRDYFKGKEDAYTSAAYRIQRLLDSDGKDT